ncbi:MAG: CvpA family protein [Sedimentisphaerales bacterium]|nr:CvpA family protein [Sedimentisphaerales bacterium]
MLTSLIVCLIVGGIAFYLVFTQGLFSSVIMAVLSLVAALIAFNYYEPLGLFLDGKGLAPYGGAAVSLMGLFCIILLVLRILADRLIRGNMRFTLLVDRIGSTVFGLICGLTIAGVVALGFQMINTPPVLIGFDRFPKLAEGDLTERSNLFPHADGFVVGMAQQASRYGFAGARPLNRRHPDLLAELYLDRLELDPYSRLEAAPDAIQLNRAWLIKDTLWNNRTGQPLAPEPGETFLAVRFTIQAGSREKYEGAGDPDGKIRFALGNVRLLGFDAQQPKQAGIVRYPLGVLLPGWLAIDGAGLQEGRVLPASRAVDLLFAWPGDMKEVPPRYLEFKKYAWEALPSVAKLEENGPPELADQFMASAAAATATLVAPPDPTVSYACLSLTVLDRTDEQPLNQMHIPSIGTTMEIRQQQEFQELEPIQQQGGLYRQLHVVLQETLHMKDSETRGLLVPDNYYLAFVPIDGKNQVLNQSFALPVLVDIQKQQYPPAGILIRCQGKGRPRVELAYTIDPQRIQGGFPETIELLKSRAPVMDMVLFYLIPRPQNPIGLIGCQTRPTRNASGQIWSLESGVDVVLVPPPSKS